VSPSGQSPVGEYDLGPIRFPRNSGAYEALSKLSATPGGFEIRSAATVERDKDGHLHMPEGGDTMAGRDAAGRERRRRQRGAV
jgi:hypothetical protein